MPVARRRRSNVAEREVRLHSQHRVRARELRDDPDRADIYQRGCGSTIHRRAKDRLEFLHGLLREGSDLRRGQGQHARAT
jgi:hypothetical protein